MLGLFSFCVLEAPAKRLHNAPTISIRNSTKSIASKGFLAFLLLFFIGAAEASTFPYGKALNEGIKLDAGRGGSVRACWAFGRADKPLTDRQGSIIELTALIPAERQPMPKTQANKEPESSKKLGILPDEIINILNDGVIQRIFLWFFFGLICGGAFGRTP